MLNIYMFLVGVGTGVDVNLVGRVAFSEILMGIGLPFLLITNRGSFNNSTFRTLAVFLVLYAGGVVIADISVGNELIYFIRGIARPVFLAFMTLFFVLALKRNFNSVYFLFLGMLPGAILGFFDPTELVGEFYVGTYNYFNAKWTPILTYLAVFLSIISYRYSHVLTAILILIPGIVVGVYGSRSAAVTFFLASFTIIFMRALHQREKQIKLTKKLIFKVALFFAFSTASLYFLYIYAAPRGFLGELQRDKFYTQSSTKYGATPWGLIAAGRFDFIVSLLAVRDSPLIGHGSWPQIGEYQVEATLILGNSLSTEAIRSFYQEIGSGHSVIMGSWMNHGILAAIYWLYVMYLTFLVTIYFIRRENTLSAAILLPFYMFTWAFFFSPFNLPVRLFGSLFSALAVCLLDKKKPLIVDSANAFHRGRDQSRTRITSER